MFKKFAIAIFATAMTMAAANASVWEYSQIDDKHVANSNSYGGKFNLSLICNEGGPKAISLLINEGKGITIAEDDTKIKYLDNTDQQWEFDMINRRGDRLIYIEEQQLVDFFIESIRDMPRNVLGISWGGNVDMIDMAGYEATIDQFLKGCDGNG